MGTDSGLKYLKCSGEVAGAVIAPSCSYLGERYQGGRDRDRHADKCITHPEQSCRVL